MSRCVNERTASECFPVVADRRQNGTEAKRGFDEFFVRPLRSIH
jgi:hypothetical protein